MKPRSTGVALSGMIVLLLVGCSVVTGVTAVTVREGHVIALVRMCGTVTSDAVWHDVYGEQDIYTITPIPERSFADVDLGSLDDFLDGDSEAKYWIQSSTSSGDGGFVAFSAKDLEGLRDDEVLMKGSATSTPETLRSSEFDTFVDMKCEPFKH